MFEEFLTDNNAWEMYITGAAGTGKTTSLKTLVEHLIEKEIPYVVCAFTHRACNVLASKLPYGSNITTLHSVLRKRPTINDMATRMEHVEVSKQHSKPDKYRVMLIDEFSMVGEKDYLDIGAIQDPDYEGEPRMKVVYIGDPNQLPPVGDLQTIIPSGKYHLHLTQVYRQAEGNKLLDILTDLANAISNKTELKSIQENANFIKHCELIPAYNNCNRDKILLAYTNKKVQELNALVAGKADPEHGDALFCPTNRQNYEYICECPYTEIHGIILPYNNEYLTFNSKYKTLEYLLSMANVQLANVFSDEEESTIQIAYVFGHETYRSLMNYYKSEAARANKIIEEEFKMQSKVWAGANPHHKLARQRARAWRDYLTFKDCVHCLDFPYAMTIHKSQGSTYENVFLDLDDLNSCADRDYQMYLRLAYVAISRASQRVYTN